MIKEINLSNWKSFKNLNFKFENINILIGSNASGKTNFLDALEFTKLKAINNNNNNDDEINRIIGGRKFFKTFGASLSSIETLLYTNGLGYEFKIEIDKENEITSQITESLLTKLKKIPKNEENSKNSLEILTESLIKLGISDLMNLKLENSKEIEGTALENIIENFSKFVQRRKKALEQIKHITILDPIPREIRGEAKVSQEDFLRKDCSNLISFTLNHVSKIELEEKLLKYLKKLLGETIQKIEFMALGENQEFC